jgi:signal transduction histidine kinase
MTQGEAELAMQPFRQIDNSLSRKYEGTGLGLPLTKSLVELHGGTMTIDSAPGVGTTVTVGLPKWRMLPAETAAVGARADRVANG